MNNLEKLIKDNTWQDIEDAPKDGKYIITLVDGFLPTIGWWNASEWTNDRQEKDRALSEIIDEQYNYEPTHFRPLPDDKLAEVCQVLIEALKNISQEQYSDEYQPNIDEPNSSLAAYQALAKAEQIAKGS